MSFDVFSKFLSFPDEVSENSMKEDSMKKVLERAVSPYSNAMKSSSFLLGKPLLGLRTVFFKRDILFCQIVFRVCHNRL